MVVNHEKVELFLALFLMNSGKKHAAGINAHHRSRRKICDCDTSLADKLLRLIISVNTAEDRSVLARAVVKCELKKLLRLLNSNAVLNLNCSEIRLLECIKINVILEQRLNLNL